MAYKIRLLVFIAAIVHHARGEAQDTSESAQGLSKYWSDNYKDIHHIYGRTSDLDLYGETLPQSVTHGGGTEHDKFRKSKLSGTQTDSSASGSHQDNYEFGNTYPQLVASRKRLNNEHRLKPKSTKYGQLFTAADSSDFKFPNEADPATIEYLKQFDHLETQQAIDFPQEGLSGFKPYIGLNYRNAKNQQHLDAYKSIQDIIDANDNQEESPILVNQRPLTDLTRKPYGYIPKIQFEGIDNIAPQRIKGKPEIKYQGKSSLKKPKRSRCSSSRCRKPFGPLRLRKIRPRITKIKHRIVSLSD